MYHFPTTGPLDSFWVEGPGGDNYDPFPYENWEAVEAEQTSKALTANTPATLSFDSRSMVTPSQFNATLAGPNYNLAGISQTSPLELGSTPRIYHAESSTYMALRNEENLEHEDANVFLTASNDHRRTSAVPTQSNLGAILQYAKPSEWEKYKDTISQLYLEKKLKDVISIMKTKYNFNATEKMYKDRAKKWGVHKYHKSPEMRAIAHKVHERSLSHKRTASFVWGKEVPYKEVVRYWKRQKRTIDQVVADRRRSVTPPYVRCITPTQLVPSTPRKLALSEELLHRFEVYYSGSFEDGTWMAYTSDHMSRVSYNSVRDVAISTCNRFRSNIFMALAKFRTGNFVEGGQALFSATAYLEDLVQLKTPWTLQYIFDVCMHLFYQSQPKISQIMLQQFSMLANRILQKNDPLHQLCLRISGISKSDFETMVGVLQRCISIVSGSFEKYFGRWHWETFPVKALEHRSHVHRCGFEEQKAKSMRMMNSLCESSGVPGKTEKLAELKLDLAYAFWNLNDYRMADKVCLEVLATLSNEKSNYFRGTAFYLLSCISYKREELADAIVRLKQAIQEYRARSPSRARAHWLVQLEDWLIEAGRFEEAEKVREEWQGELVPPLPDD